MRKAVKVYFEASEYEAIKAYAATKQRRTMSGYIRHAALSEMIRQTARQRRGKRRPTDRKATLADSRI